MVPNHQPRAFSRAQSTQVDRGSKHRRENGRNAPWEQINVGSLWNFLCDVKPDGDIIQFHVLTFDP